MRVLHVIPAVGSLYGGLSKAVLELVEALGQLEIQVDLVTTNANSIEKLDVPLKRWIQKEHYRIQYFPCWNPGDYKLSTSMSNWLFRHTCDYDIVNTHAIFSLATLPAYWMCQYGQVPYVIHPHGMLETWALSYKSWKKQPYYNLIEKPALQRASTIRVLASREAENIEHLHLNTPLTLLPNGIWKEDFLRLSDPEILYQAFPQIRGKTLILFMGRIDPKKGLDLLATAFSKIHHEFPNTHLVLAGPDNNGFLATAQNYFVEAGCLSAVTFTGMLTGAIKSAAFAAADIYVAPSYSEGFSMSVLEGMASGLPCVFTTGCNFPEAAAAKVAHVVEIDAIAIANALTLCLNDPEPAKAMGDRARQFVFENYTWEKIAANLVKTYQTILDQRSSS
jgi:glycosyltransferase involved in cell wall biosynthesis